MYNESMKNEFYQFPESLGYLTIVTGRLFSAFTNRELASMRLDLTAEQWALLRLLLNEDGKSQDELLHRTRCEKSSLSRLLEGMENKGLVRRERDARDGRRKRVFLTEKGGAQGVQGTGHALETLHELYAGIDPDDLDTCRRVLLYVQTELLRKLGWEEA